MGAVGRLISSGGYAGRDPFPLIVPRLRFPVSRVKRTLKWLCALTVSGIGVLADPGDQVPAVITQVFPWYPTKLYNSKYPGEVLVDFYVDTEGNVRNASVVRWTRPEFIPNSLEAVQQWKFRPGMRNGKAVNTHMQVPIVFGVDDHLNYSKIKDPEHLYQIGTWFQEDVGKKPDFAKALDCFRLAATQDYAKAQYALGMMYASGRGVKKDTVEGSRWIRLAADQDYAPAQCIVGMTYAAGEGVAVDLVEAVRWYRKSARHDYARAQYLLAICLNTGAGTPANPDEAATLLKLAAHQHFIPAASLLGQCYFAGEAVEKDRVQAYSWLKIASIRGDKTAIEKLPIVERELSPREKAEGDRLATQYSTEYGVMR